MPSQILVEPWSKTMHACNFQVNQTNGCVVTAIFMFVCFFPVIAPSSGQTPKFGENIPFHSRFIVVLVNVAPPTLNIFASCSDRRQNFNLISITFANHTPENFSVLV